jgi:hypothetical protein
LNEVKRGEWTCIGFLLVAFRGAEKAGCAVRFRTWVSCSGLDYTSIRFGRQHRDLHSMGFFRCARDSEIFILLTVLLNVLLKTLLNTPN